MRGRGNYEVTGVACLLVFVAGRVGFRETRGQGVNPVTNDLECPVLGLAPTPFTPVVDGHEELGLVGTGRLLAGETPAVERADFGIRIAAGHLVGAVAESANAVPGELAIHVDRAESQEFVGPAVRRRRVLATSEAVQEDFLAVRRAVRELGSRAHEEDGAVLLGLGDDEALGAVIFAVAVEVVAGGDFGEVVVADVLVVGRILHFAGADDEEENDGRKERTHERLLKGGNENVEGQ